ncbi:lipopolysaccharide biosynthesis protein [Salinarchaeum laminariae]|uniref:lipopolysaccharide biosynthesis protein n=1 Tax=Salinarchaeum laminariae TaxID=869888 RepID=UPI0020BF01E0|nr:polysaccharide biosynthesis C-terminal domain-containing protein [Salinarchaeum laminariae]
MDDPLPFPEISIDIHDYSVSSHEEDFRMRLGRTTLAHFGSHVAISIAGFVATLYIARELGSSVLGLYNTTVALLFWTTLPVSALESAMKKRISEGTDQGSFMAAGAIGILFLASLMAIFSLLLSSQIDGYVGASVSYFFVLLLLGNGLVNIVGTTLKAQKNVGRAGAVNAFNQVLRTALQIGLIVVGYELGGILVGHVVAFFVAAVVGLRYVTISPSRPGLDHFRSLYEYARYSWLGTLKSRAFAWMDTLILAVFVAPELIGIYGVAWNLASMLSMVSTSVSQTLFPEMSELSVNDGYDRIHHYMEEGLVFVGIFSFPGFVGALVIGPRLLRIYSPEFQRGSTILLLLIVATTVAAFGGLFVNTVNAIDRPDIAFRINLAFVITNAVLNTVLIWAMGWYGAAIATLLSATVLLGAGYYSVSELIGRPSIPAGEIAREIVAACVMGVLVVGLNRVVPTGNFLTVGIVLVGAATYTIVLVGLSDRIRSKAIGLSPM